ncbi:MAG: hypothetical protein WD607_09835, partial [Candidatus Paceibacterota bacterium]
TIIESASKKSDGQKIRQVWSEVLDCEEKDDAEITKRVVEVYNLTQDVQRLIKLIPDINYDLFLTAFPKIERAIFPLNLNANWKNQKMKLDPGVITTLRFCSEELNKHYSEEGVSEEDLVDVKKQIDELFEIVNSSKIDPLLRLTLLEELERIRSAIAMYQIKGAKGLSEALQSTIGAIVSKPNEIKELKKQKPKIMDKLFKILGKIDTITSRALKVKKLIFDPIMAMIGNGNAG